jgi:hypothetical protein
MARFHHSDRQSPEQLERTFPSNELIRTGQQDVPIIWRSLLAVSVTEAVARVCEILQLRGDSPLSKALSSAHDFAAVAPARRRDRAKFHMWRFAIIYSQHQTFQFYCPRDDFPVNTLRVDEHYARIVTLLGIFQFHVASGIVMWPLESQRTAELLTVQTGIELIPFYNHKTGDFDCWTPGSFDTTFTFSHETNSVSEYSRGGFAAWIEKRFCDDQVP